jgi:hypothetical protein
MRAIASIRPDIWCLGKVARLTAKAKRVKAARIEKAK